MKSRKYILLTVIAVVVALSYTYMYGGVLNGTANLVLGQADFIGNAQMAASATTVNNPNAIVIDKVNGRVYVADTYNHRVLWWNNAAGLASGQAADGVLGQVNFTAVLPNQGLGAPTDGTLVYPSAVFVDDASRLWVVDSGNNRVLRFDAPVTKATADLVLGQPNMTSAYSSVGRDRLYWPLGVAVDASGTVWVVDNGNNRVVGYSAANLASRSADYVIGQPDFVTRTTAATAGASTLNTPQAVFVDPSGNLWIADDSNSRMLRFNPPFTSIGMTPNLVLGQADFKGSNQNRGGFADAGTLHCPFSMTADTAGNYWVADFTNNRILRYSGTLTNGMNAVQVIGQPDFSSVASNRGGSASASTLFHPNCVALDGAGNLWVTEGESFSVCHSSGNNRILRFNMARIQSVAPGQAHNGRPLTLTIQGAGMAAGMTAKLVKTGQKEIVGSGATFAADESQMQCTFDLTGAAAGSWDLVLETGGISVTLPNAFVVLAVKITAVSPNQAINDAPVDVVITGENLFDGVVPRLAKQGRPDINGQSVVFVSSTQVNCRFDILDAATGFWNVGVTVITEGALADGFVIHFPSSVARNILRSRAYQLGMETASGIFTFNIPAGAFTRDVFFNAHLPLRVVPAVSEREFKATDIAVEAYADANLQPVKELGIGFFYRDNMANGFDRTKLAAVFCDEESFRWIPVNSRCDGGGTCVMSRSRHLCIFRLVELIPSLNLTGIKVYPNPYTPGSSDLHDDALMGQGIVFSGLTGRVTIKIFTIAGEQVLQHEEANGSGFFVWDTKNDKGEKVASGVYVYFVNDPENGSEKKKGRLAIVR